VVESDSMPPAVPPNGPFVTAAFICDQVIEGKDGTLTAVRIIDRFVVTARGAAGRLPPAMPPQPIPLTMLISLKSGGARGRHTVSLRPEKPSGQRLEAVDFPILLEGEERGANQIVQMEFPVDEEGLYWFDVLLDGILMTRIPMRVVYQPLALGTSVGG
jgi:hypothetical protein